jgi:hypothetical protein
MAAAFGCHLKRIHANSHEQGRKISNDAVDVVATNLFCITTVALESKSNG